VSGQHGSADPNSAALIREKEVAKEKLEEKDKFFDFYVKQSEVHFDQFQKHATKSQDTMLAQMTLLRESAAAERDKDRDTRSSCDGEYED
jgi:DNA-directed RNA polymerase beta' subunit